MQEVRPAESSRPKNDARRYRKSDHCLNCGEPISLNFCPRCGQENHQLIVPVHHLLADILDEFFKLDSKLFRSLQYLISRPGFLTNEYIAGRRASYVAPFRFYFIVSAIWFLLAAMTGLQNEFQREFALNPGLKVDVHNPVKPKVTSTDRNKPANDPKTAMMEVQEAKVRRSFTERLVRLGGWISNNQSIIAFAMGPIIAFVLSVLYYPQRRMYIEHLVFAAHFTTFVFTLWFVLFIPLFNNWWGWDLITLGGPLIYLFLSMRAVYGQSRFVTLVKEFALGCGCLTSLMICGVIVMLTIALLSLRT